MDGFYENQSKPWKDWVAEHEKPCFYTLKDSKHGWQFTREHNMIPPLFLLGDKQGRISIS